MSRVTPPVTKFALGLRTISRSATAGQSLSSRAARFQLPRHLKETASVESDVLEKNTESQAFHTLGSHRPAPRAARIVPLMQGFQTSAPKQAALDTSTIDLFFLPPVPAPPPTNPFSKLRVPLLPDNYAPDRSSDSAHALETPVEALPREEISIMAAHPDKVVHSMSEVVGNDGLDVDIGQLAEDFVNKSSTATGPKEPGVLKELWAGLVDDVFGPKAKLTV